MRRNIKVLILGIVIGIVIASSIAVASTLVTKDVYINPFKILLNGSNYEPKMPILNYEGRTYVPLRELATLTGSEVDFKNENIIINNKNSLDIKKYLIENDLINENDKTYVIDLDNDGVDEILVWDGHYIGFGSTPQVWYVDEKGNAVESDVVSDNLLQVLDIKQVLDKETGKKKCILISEFADGYCYTNYIIAELDKELDNVYIKKIFEEVCDQEAEAKTEFEVDGEIEWEHILRYMVNKKVVSENEFIKSVEKYWIDNKVIDEYKINIY